MANHIPERSNKDTVEVLRHSEERVDVQDKVISGVRFKVESLIVYLSDEDHDGIRVASDNFSTVYGAGETTTLAVE